MKPAAAKLFPEQVGVSPYSFTSRTSPYFPSTHFPSSDRSQGQLSRTRDHGGVEKALLVDRLGGVRAQALSIGYNTPALDLLFLPASQAKEENADESEE